MELVNPSLQERKNREFKIVMEKEIENSNRDALHKLNQEYVKQSSSAYALTTSRVLEILLIAITRMETFGE